MSRGGRGGGFGRGGGGGGPASGAMQLVSFDLLKDLGSGSLFNVNTALFPDMDVPIPRKPTSTESTQWKYKKEYLDLNKNSPYNLSEAPPPPDIVRYSDRYKVEKRKRTIREIETALDFFPEEQQNTLDPKKRKKQKVDITNNEYDQIEALLNAEGDNDDKEDEDGEEKKEEEEEELDNEYEEEEELIDDNDYAQNYFDNGEGDDDDGDEGEGDYY